MHLADEGQRLGAAQAVEQRQILGHDADLPLDGDRIARADRGRESGSVPAVGRSSPVRHLIVVDLPAPLGPRKP